MMRVRQRFCLAALLVFATCLPATHGHAANTQIVIGTGNENGVYFPAGGAIRRFVNRGSQEHGIHCTVESTGGSIYNLNAIAKGTLDIAMAQSDWQYNAHAGKGVFADKGPNAALRSLFSLYSEAFTVVARADANIAQFDDLRGKRVSIGDLGSGQRATMEAMMKQKGWTQASFAQASTYKPDEQAEALCAGTIDAFVFTAGHPNRAILAVANRCDVRLVPVTGDVVATLMQQFPYYAKSTIPGGMYRGNPDDTQTFGVKATFVSSTAVSDEVVYQVVKAVFENFDAFKTLHPVFASLTKQGMMTDGLSAPLHAGAERYYREVGLLK